MIRHSALDPTPPSILTLDHDGRAFMLATLNASIATHGGPTPEQWREAYGKAADYQTARNARLVLARGGEAVA